MIAPGGDEIAEFYDRHPYPPPVTDLDAEVEAWDDGIRRRVEHFRMWPSVPYRDDHTILVAGCGTSQAARYSLRYPNAQVVGIDVSPTSIAATHQLIEQYELTNVELHDMPIEGVASLGRSFEQVVCTGVLHHLESAAAGLRALREVLAPEGAMQLMVYATYGRSGVYVMQEYCRALGVTPTPEEITDLISTLRELPTGHPISHMLRNTPDFQDDDAIADALLNPRDRSYTVPELFGLLGEAGMRLGRFVRQAPYRPQCGALTEVPHGERIAAMSESDQFAAVELFRGTMRRHSVIAHRVDSPLPDPPIRWSEDAWRSYVPIRPTSVVIVEENIPPGTDAVLINKAHTDRDLVFFLSTNERRIYETIDGERPIGEIDGATADLFRRLWDHDLVMIDVSRRSA
ncbi:MAG: class I SAM-dependent methyltransferase [Acidobacteria bacterium]|nr:class I SAM-dependent methyltransferase [Acidobacteriota bacterium]